MNIVFNKNDGSIVSAISDDQDYKIYYQNAGQEFVDNLDVIIVDQVPIQLGEYYIKDGELVKYTDLEYKEVELYGKILTEEERTQIAEKENQAREEQEIKEQEQEAMNDFAKVSFAVMAPTMTQTQILQFEPLVENWELGKYSIGDIRKHDGQVWKCVQGHDNTNNPDIEPSKSPAHWTFFKSKDIKYAKEYIQPTGSHDAYMADEYCIYEGKYYKSIIDNNVWNPENYSQGWELIE